MVICDEGAPEHAVMGFGNILFDSFEPRYWPYKRRPSTSTI